MVTNKDDISPVSYFTGPLVHKDTGDVLMCQKCGKERAMWLHETKDGSRLYLCFGCGDH